jgi:hypothetical protein
MTDREGSGSETEKSPNAKAVKEGKDNLRTSSLARAEFGKRAGSPSGDVFESDPTKILLEDAMGDLGLHVANTLKTRGAGVSAVDQRGTAADWTAPLREVGMRAVGMKVVEMYFRARSPHP